MTISARQFLDAVLDPGTYVSWDRAPLIATTDDDYLADLDRARTRSGVDESVITGEGTVDGRRVAMVACEFTFLAGSIGVAAAERITLAVERATAEGLPVIASPTSGGTRMQEGTAAFVQMVTIASAVTLHRKSGLPYLVYLRHPTTGGVFASWGSLGHMTFAEPGALIGFLGPRVYEALYGERFPEGVQTAENLFRCGVIDAVIPADELRDVLLRALVVLQDPPRPDEEPTPTAELHTDTAAWDSVLRSRQAERPGVRDWVAATTTHLIPLSGTGTGESDSTVTLSLARFRGRSCVLFGQDRTGQTPQNTMGPEALREALRGMRLAEELRLPLVLVIDTLGASLSREAEEHGLAPEIARCISTLITLDTPTVSVLLGQGTGGGALALLPADRVVAAEHAWLAPLPPEGASAIVHRDTAHAPDMAGAQGIRSRDLLAAGIVDTVVAENPDDPSAFLRELGRVVAGELSAVAEQDPGARQAERLRRFRTLGR